MCVHRCPPRLTTCYLANEGVQVTITRLDENCRLSIGWATNRAEHDSHVGMQGVSLGFSATNGRVLFCGGQPAPFLTGVSGALACICLALPTIGSPSPTWALPRTTESS